MKFFNTIFFIVFILRLDAQVVTGLSAYWDDSFLEWIIYTDDEHVEGTLQPRWLHREDWTEWEWELGDEQVSIRQTWDNDPTQWQVRGYNGDIVTCRAAWKNDLSEWKITNNSTTLTLRPRWANNPNEWVVRERSYGEFAIYTDFENDPRDWIVYDNLDERITANMRIALLFLAIYHSIPKR